ncbi:MULTISPECIES: bifunctional tRNA (5-methylaminomethyl-2-thiouridine)(34)-methyltransferase MnmD/FAD-dependent 5-carboxymethylaminomethyl-2-thiouridine(34) oxidoreductase MnmC [unclassified Cobetia]|uniref:bifunctional tRNA (5-methylaminomethyl-2-thiouridine)(34)-methyltransferase MnmD/FAD-dependent 5-carboxymethylaminomethyl-2-thiouridine(34) oxidoreductase MnmC n=1 Tax=Cobetia sp. Dlab-2-AX TaxID=2954488 RepID=UPI002096C3EC|nr:bifunctional tRNA (5-methylaminomethyl-2-thiouridine)(34)-methyltransferase MnmD/FAD-dependent 5-carboxymethylaminomethyl-2-thiouridine(34) oxidoreductase MnmC [Cobetia sp. Dlab-2-AX]MCO7235816.1 bifunctional tRNA (5-methylaminomethyl-2-thiouridine)(34)-methyltransferase MnmD/FAD-dependent 5-carboxymethylaminomethyl-2-thiouridine(34) oxidoreductase MnmC [Cobetia sp. Dlab-2-U]
MPDVPLAPLAALEEAQLEWDDTAPQATDYGDVYFSIHDGRAETVHVFLDSNRLSERFRDWQEARPFVIGETGFGTGLNILCAAQRFLATAPAEARLHVISVEKHPMRAADLERALSAWPDLASLAKPLVAQWPAAVLGVHRLWLDERITLDLHFGDAVERLSRLEGGVDAWFLDGFSPSKNPKMWSPELFAAMAGVSRPTATFATFTAAGFVRRGLRAAGFVWRKVPGHGMKREMICGELDEPTAAARAELMGLDASSASGHAPMRAHAVRGALHPLRREQPWTQPPQPAPVSRETHVAVLGAGIAGTSCAEALARRGVKVTLIDAEALGARASGNRQGALYVKLAAETNPASRFQLAALQYSRRWLANLDPEQTLWSASGVLQLATSERERKRQQRFLDNHPLPEALLTPVSASEASRIAGSEIAFDGIFYPVAGWVRPSALCQHLAATPGIRFLQARIEAIQSLGAEEGKETRNGAPRWQLQVNDGSYLEVDQMIVALGEQTHLPEPLAHLPLQPIRGQVSEITVAPEHAAHLPALDSVVCAGGYVSPYQRHADGSVTLSFGATFAPRDEDEAVREADHAANVAELRSALPAFTAAWEQARGVRLEDDAWQGRVAWRAASPDKSPLAGPAPDAAQWREDYAAMAFDAKKRVPQTSGAHLPGLWLSTAHGSRGFTTAPLCAELIASQLCGEPLPLERELAEHLHPGRRLIRDIVQRR